MFKLIYNYYRLKELEEQMILATEAVKQVQEAWSRYWATNQILEAENKHLRELVRLMQENQR